MITEQHLEALLRDELERVEIPTDGAQAIRRALEPDEATPPTTTTTARHLRPRLVIGSGIAALIIAVVAIAVSNNPTPTLQRQVAQGIAQAAGSPMQTPGPNSFTVNSDSKSSGFKAPASAPGINAGAAPKIIATGTLTLTIAKSALNRDVEQLRALAASLGGFVAQADIAEKGSFLGGSVVLRVPASSFNRLIAATERLGPVRGLSLSDSDVTGAVADLGARIHALVIVRGQLEGLLARTGKVPDLLAVENQIANVQSQLEQLQSQQRVLNDQVAYSSLTADLTVVQPPVGHASTSGFGHAWHRAIAGFLGGLKAVTADSGVVLFSILGLAALALVAFGLRRVALIVIRRRA